MKRVLRSIVHGPGKLRVDMANRVNEPAEPHVRLYTVDTAKPIPAHRLTFTRIPRYAHSSDKKLIHLLCFGMRLWVIVIHVGVPRLASHEEVPQICQSNRAHHEVHLMDLLRFLDFTAGIGFTGGGWKP